jgi:hypothetical protein
MVVQSNTKPKFKYGILFLYFGYMNNSLCVCMYFSHYFNFLIELFQVKAQYEDHFWQEKCIFLGVHFVLFWEYLRK